MKICSKCKEDKEISQFSKQKAAKDGHSCYCKACNRAYTKQWVEDNHDKSLAKRRLYVKKNEEKIRTQRSAYNKANRPYFREMNRKYNLENPERYLLYDAKKRAKQGSLPFNLVLEDILIPEFCPVLGVKIERGCGSKRAESPSLDRLIPELGYVKGNVAVISFRANWVKGNATAEELFKIANWVAAQVADREVAA